MVPAVQPAGPDRRRAEPRLQHLSELRYQHELAVLRAGDHDGLPRADGRADSAQLHVCRHRHRARPGPHSRLCPARGEGDRQFLGRSDPHDSVRAAAVVDCGRPVLRVAGHAAESGCLCRCNDIGGCQADDRPGPRRLAGGDQDDGGQMGAASSTPTRLIPTRTRMRLPTSCSWC